MYSLAPTQTHSEDKDNEENTPEISTILIRQSHHHYTSMLYLSSNTPALKFKHLNCTVNAQKIGMRIN